MPKSRLLGLLAATGILVVVGVSPSALAQQPQAVKAVLQVQNQTNKAAVSSQQRVDKLADQTQRMLGDYLDVVEQTDRLRTYNNQLEKLIASQQQNIASLKKQMAGVDVVQQGLIPLMLQMINSLEQFIKLDVPFQLKARLQKVADLRAMMDDSDVTIAEKYRKVMQAYTDEIDAGKTIQAYRGQLNQGGKKRSVDFLQVGRLVLAYQTLDRSETGFWNKQARKWEVLPDSYRAGIKEGLEIAHKQIAPALLRLPVQAPETAK